MGDKDDGIGTTTANVLGTTTASRSFVRHMFRRPRSHICPFHRPHKRTFIGPINETFCSDGGKKKKKDKAAFFLFFFWQAKGNKSVD